MKRGNHCHLRRQVPVGHIQVIMAPALPACSPCPQGSQAREGLAQLTIRAAKAACDKCPREPQALSLDSTVMKCAGWWYLQGLYMMVPLVTKVRACSSCWVSRSCHGLHPSTPCRFWVLLNVQRASWEQEVVSFLLLDRQDS